MINIHQCLQDPFFYPICNSLNQAVNHTTLEGGKSVNF